MKSKCLFRACYTFEQPVTTNVKSKPQSSQSAPPLSLKLKHAIVLKQHQIHGRHIETHHLQLFTTTRCTFKWWYTTHKCKHTLMCINRQGLLCNMLLLGPSLILCLIILQGHSVSRGCAQELVSEHEIRVHLLALCPVLRVPIGSAGHVKQTADGSRTEVSPAADGRPALMLQVCSLRYKN